MNTFLQLDYAYSYIYTYSYIQKKFRRYNEHKKIIQKVFDSVEESLVSDIVLQSLVSQLCRLSDLTMSYQIFMSTYQIFRLGTYSRVYTLFKDIYAAHFLKLFDIYKCLRIETIFIQYNEKIPRIKFFFETQPVACQVTSHG